MLLATLSSHDSAPPPAAGSDQARMASLIVRIAERQDKAAFAALFRHYAPRVKSFMVRKGASFEQADDLAQETLLAVWNKAHLYAPEKGSVTTWVYTIARNLRIDRLRRESSVHFTEIDGYDEASDDPGSDVQLNRSQEDARVAASLAELPAEQAQILVMSYVEDMPQSEIAERLKLPLGTVKSRMRLAYRKLRRSLEDLE
jgi:RNA polymerase sigma-70 factor (ECF subfamily)